MGDVFAFSVSVIDCGFLLFAAGYFLITLSDLECDYLNASSCCAKLNRLVLPELIVQSLTLLLLLINFHFWFVAINLPFLLYIINKYIGIPKGSIGLYDPTEIHNRRQLQFYMKESIMKLIYHCIFFFLYLYGLISSFFYPVTSEGS